MPFYPFEIGQKGKWAKRAKRAEIRAKAQTNRMPTSLYMFNNVGRPSPKEFRLSTSTRPDGLHFEGKHNLSEVSIVY